MQFQRESSGMGEGDQPKDAYTLESGNTFRKSTPAPGGKKELDVAKSGEVQRTG